MRKLPAQEEKIRVAIRDIIALNPLVSTESIRNDLLTQGFKTANDTPLNWHYIAKLRNKVHQQSIENVNRQNLIQRIAEFKEKNRIVFERLVDIAFYDRSGRQPPSYKDQIAALNAIVKLDLAIFDAELDAGVFERHMGKIEVEKRYIPLPEELKSGILKALHNYGFTLDSKVTDAQFTSIPNTATEHN